MNFSIVNPNRFWALIIGVSLVRCHGTKREGTNQAKYKLVREQHGSQPPRTRSPNHEHDSRNGFFMNHENSAYRR